MKLVCVVCGKTGTHAGDETEMLGHVLRNHPETIPERIDELVKQPALLTDLRRQNESKEQRGMFDKLFREVDAKLGQPHPPALFPEEDVVLSNGIQLVHQGRDGSLRCWESKKHAVRADADELSADVSISRLDQKRVKPDVISAVCRALYPPSSSMMSMFGPVREVVGKHAVHLMRFSNKLSSAEQNQILRDLRANMPIVNAVVDSVVDRIEKAGRNEPCPCGSGKKYKKCHGDLTRAG